MNPAEYLDLVKQRLLSDPIVIGFHKDRFLTPLSSLCDVNQDGACTSIDALFLLQCDVGIANLACP